MIGLVLVTHGRLALEFLAAMEHVVGPQAQVRTVCIDADDDMERRRADIVEAAKDVNTGDGVILVTDMFGGTPSNLAISAMQKGTVEVIAGMNVPMLIKLAELRESTSVSDAVRQAQDAGRKYIAVASALLDVGA
jgi:PTS system mannose-specific IIA component